ncbi:MAG: hypothetical protein ACM33B_04870 [Pseudomonadota bacterium]
MTAELERAYAAIVDEARAQVAAGRRVDGAALEARIRAAGARAGADAAAERRALRRLHGVLAVARARALLSREPEPPPAPPPRRPTLRRPALRARPTISANMELARVPTDDGLRLTWPSTPAVRTWEIRVAERREGRAEYDVRETRTLPGDATETALVLSDRPLRVHVLGRGRDGRLLRRAIVSGLTRENRDVRWERRPSAS